MPRRKVTELNVYECLNDETDKIVFIIFKGLTLSKVDSRLVRLEKKRRKIKSYKKKVEKINHIDL